MMSIRSVTFLVATIMLSTATAFQSASLLQPFNNNNKVATTTKPLFVILSDDETTKIMTTAEECAEGECSIDDVAGLIYELKEQQREMEKRLEKIMNMVATLQHLNEKEPSARNVDEVRSFVKDLLRVFALHADTTKKATFTPTGFSGDIGSGSTTAYDALPPKKWTPTSQ